MIHLPDLEHSDIGEEVWTLRPENFTNLVKLRFLQLENRLYHTRFYNDKYCKKLKLEGTFDNLFPNLRWLSWHHIPPEQFNVTKFNLNKLVILDLSYSNFTESWGGWKQIQVWCSNFSKVQLAHIQQSKIINKIQVPLQFNSKLGLAN